MRFYYVDSGDLSPYHATLASAKKDANALAKDSHDDIVVKVVEALTDKDNVLNMPPNTTGGLHGIRRGRPHRQGKTEMSDCYFVICREDNRPGRQQRAAMCSPPSGSPARWSWRASTLQDASPRPRADHSQGSKMMKTYIILSNEDGELNPVELNDEDATTQAIAEAALSLILKTGMSMSVGQTIEVLEE